jgi:D-arabinonate dehydratase
MAVREEQQKQSESRTPDTGMVTAVCSEMLDIPLRRRVAIANMTITSRLYNVVRLRTSGGIEGFGITRGGILVHHAIEALAPLIVGQPAALIEAHWMRLFKATTQTGRRGAVMRALSAIDIALWDVAARATGLPLYQLLGGARTCVPVYASGGYYTDNDDPVQTVRNEVELYMERGFRAIKIKVGGAPLTVDLQRVKAAIDVAGQDVPVFLDANNGYGHDPLLALQAARAFESLGAGWLEEPMLPDDILGSARLAQQVLLPIATGEQEATRWGFRELIEQRAADILQPDVTVVGGVSEWMRVAALASTYSLPLVPHYWQDIHIHLAAAVPETRWVEYFVRETDIVTLDDVLIEPLRPVNGEVVVPNRPGVGLDFDPVAYARYRVTV